MGTVFKKVVTRPVPGGAELIQGRDGTITAKWTPRGARRPIIAAVVTLADGRKAVRQESSVYFARYRDGDRIVREVSTGCRDKSSAEQRLATLEKRADRIRAGVMTEREADAADRMRESIGRHIADYIERLPSKRGGRATEAHRRDTERCLRRLAADCGWTCPADLARTDLERWMNDQAQAGRSARSINAHRIAVGAFANWLADPLVGRLSSNPLGTGRGAIPKLDEDTDPRRPRRALTVGEIEQLIDAARKAPKRPQGHTSEGGGKSGGRPAERLSGEARADLYGLLAGTGLRVGEARQLTVADARLDASVPHIRIPANVAKSRKEQSVPLRSDLVEMLRRHIAGKAGSDRLFDVPADLIRRFNADLKRAGIAKRGPDGRTVDIHALRYSFGTMLSKAGVAPRVAMELMRHSDISLTMRTYTDPRLFDLAGAVESLPSVALSVAPSVATTPDKPGDIFTRPDRKGCKSAAS